MAWLNFGLLAGGSLFIGVPILLHLLLRQQPKQLTFPALRLVKVRQEVNQRQLELRHWLLLFLRILAVLLLAAALARPSSASADFSDWILASGTALALLVVLMITLAAWVQERGEWMVGGFGALGLVLALVLLYQMVQLRSGKTTSLSGDDEEEIAAAVLFDTSPRMEYRAKNKTRIEEAKEHALGWLLPELPAGSEVSIFSGNRGEATAPLDNAAARRVVEGLKIRNSSRAIPEVLAEALGQLKQSEKKRKEIYIFTDLTAASWEDTSGGALATRLVEVPDVLIYLVDVGVEDAQNVSIASLRMPSGEALAPGMPLRVEVGLQRHGPAAKAEVELYVELPDPEKPYILDGKVQLPDRGPPRARQEVDLAANEGAVAEMPAIGALTPGTHHGFVKLVRSDNLAIDDVRHFTIDVRAPWPILVVNGPEAEPAFVAGALAPDELVSLGQSRFSCVATSQDKLSAQDLAKYRVICLLDPAPLTDDTWAKLTEFVSSGGGLFVALGRNAFPADPFNAPAAQALLAGKLGKQPQRSGERKIFLDPRGNRHPILQPMFALAGGVPWAKYPIYYHWRMSEDQLAKGASVIFQYTDQQPALVERSVGKGHVLTLTTSLSDEPGSRPWNELPISLEAWPFVMLMHESMLYLVRGSESRLNYLVGERAMLLKQTEKDADRYQLFAPEATYSALVTARDGAITVESTDAIGAYRLRGEGGAGLRRGFSINLPPQASALERTIPKHLDQLLGSGRYQLARDRDGIERGVGEARRGREFYPLLIGLLVLILSLELILANRFYWQSSGTAAN